MWLVQRAVSIFHMVYLNCEMGCFFPLFLKDAYEMGNTHKIVSWRLSVPFFRCPHAGEFSSLAVTVPMRQAESANLLYPNLPSVFKHRSNTERQMGFDVSTYISGMNTAQMVPSPPQDTSNTMLLVVLTRTCLPNSLFLRARGHHGWMLPSTCSETSPHFLLKVCLFQSGFNSNTLISSASVALLLSQLAERRDKWTPFMLS